MEKERGLRRRDFLKTTAVGIAVVGLDMLPSGASAQGQKALETKKDVAFIQARAKEHYFVQRFNWAEATSLSFKEYLGIDSSLLPRAAAGFGGGFGLKGSLCGIFMGSVMAIGIKFGRNDPKDTKALATTNEKVKKFSERFETEFGSRNCLELAGYRIDTPDQFKKWVDSGGVKRCNAMMRRTVQFVVEDFLV
jgi:C_GCAxxG_C_C family probable redox protein